MMTRALEEFWGSLEGWRSVTMNQVRDIMEDKYSLFLPHVPFFFHVDYKTVKQTLGRMKPSAPGPDTRAPETSLVRPP